MQINDEYKDTVAEALASSFWDAIDWLDMHMASNVEVSATIANDADAYIYDAFAILDMLTNSIGYVPDGSLDSINREYFRVVDTYFNGKPWFDQ